MDDHGINVWNIKSGLYDGCGDEDINGSVDEVIHDSLKSRNKALQLYSVVYASELESPAISEIEPFVDVVNLWLGHKQQLNEMDCAIEKCRLLFPGRRIMLGVFLFDYFATHSPNTSAFLEIQLRKARQYLRDGKISDIVILGDREIAKVPREAQFTRDFFQREFQASLQLEQKGS